MRCPFCSQMLPRRTQRQSWWSRMRTAKVLSAHMTGQCIDVARRPVGDRVQDQPNARASLTDAPQGEYSGR